jgi:rod shape determining protein RodA
MSIKQIDWLVIGPIAYLSILSLIVLKSIELTTKTPLDFSFGRQLASVALSFIVLLVLVRSKDLLLKGGFYLYILSVLLLALVLTYGESSGGATRWLTIGTWQFQPSELAKLALILVQAKLLASRRHSLAKPWPLFLSVLYVLPLVLLIAVEPDLGTAIVLVAIWLAMLLMSDLPKRTFVLLIGLVLLVLPASYPFLEDYQRDRVDSFFNPSLSTQAEGYNALQATIAVGSGGLTGRGLDAGTQSQLNFLPSQHTDFIFAVIAEKLGFLGALSVILAFTLLLVRLIYISWQSSHQVVRLAGMGVIAALGLQFLINIGMNLGLAPVTGIPLPFVSGGGTHILAESAMVGLVLGLAAVERKNLYRR